MRKSTLFWILIILSIVFFWAGWASVYFSFYQHGSHKWLYPGVNFFLACLFFYLLIVFMRKTRHLLIISAILTLPSVILGGEYWYNMFAVWALSLFLFSVGLKRIKIEQYNRIKINVYRILRRGVPIIGTAISLIIAGGFYFSIISKSRVGEIPKIDVNISKETTNNVLGMVNFFVQTQELEWILQGLTIDEYISNTLQVQGSAQPLDFEQGGGQNVTIPEVDFSSLSEDRKEEILAQNRQALSRQLNLEINQNTRIDELINGMINKRVNEILNGDIISSSIVPIGVAFGMFITIRSLVWVLNGALYWIAVGGFMLLAKTKKIVVRRETREVEQIHWV